MNAIVQIIGVTMLVLTPLLLVVSGVVFFFACQFRRDQKRDEATRVVTEDLKRAEGHRNPPGGAAPQHKPSSTVSAPEEPAATPKTVWGMLKE